MQAARHQSKNDVTRSNFAAVDDFAVVNHSDDATGEIVFAFAIHPGHLRGLAADECAASGSTRAGKSTQQLIENALFKFFAANVIEKEKRTRAEHSDVVHAMIDEIGADCAVPVHRECNFQFRADTVDARCQYRIAHPGKLYSKQTAEAAGFTEHFRPVRLPDELPDSSFELVAKIDIYARARVGFLLFVHRFHRFSQIISESICVNLRNLWITSGPRTASDVFPDRPALWRGFLVFP